MNRKKRTLMIRVISLMIAATIIGAGSGYAAILFWDGGGADNNWSTKENWDIFPDGTGGDPGAGPAGGDTVIFNYISTTKLTTGIIDAIGAGTGTGISIRIQNISENIAFTVDTAVELASGTSIDMTAAMVDMTIIGGTGSITLDGAATFDVRSGRTLTISESIDNTGGNLTIQGVGNTTISGIISGNRQVIKTGTGTLTLTGNNTYTSQTTVSAGTLNIQHSNALGTATTSVATDASLELVGDISVGNNLTISGGGATELVSVSGNNTWAGPCTLSVSVDIKALSGSLTLSSYILGGNLIFDCNTGDITANGALGPAGITVTKSGTGTLNLNASNIFGGALTISDGTCVLNHVNAFGTGAGGISLGGDILLRIGTPIDAFNWDPAITLTGAATIECAAPSEIDQTIDNGGFLLTISGDENFDISGDIVGGGGLTKTGANKLTISGTTNTYTGTTTINAGILNTGAANTIPDDSSVILADNATAVLTLGGNETIASLSGGGTTGGNINLGTSTLTVTQAADLTYGGVISGTGGLIKAGAQGLTLGGANTYTGATTVNAGTINFNGIATGASAVTASNAGTKVAGTGTIPGAVTMNDGTILVPGGTNGDAVGTITVNGNLTFNGESTYMVTVTGGSVDKIIAGGNVAATGHAPNVEIQAGYSTAGLIIPATIMDITGSYTAFDESALPSEWDIDNVKYGDLIRITAAPGAFIPTLNEWGIIILLLLLASAAIMLMRKIHA